MSRWFRIYDEALDDPKVQRLPAEDFRGWFNLLCLASRHGGKLPPLQDIAFALRRSLDDASTLVERLRDGGLIDSCSGGANGSHDAPHAWTKRQYKSDGSTERVKRFRQRSKAVSETPPETDTEADTEIVVAKATTPRQARGVRIADDWSPTRKLPETVEALASQWPEGRYDRELEGFRDYWSSRTRDAAKSDWDKAWHNRIRDQHDRIMKDQRNGSIRQNRSTSGYGTTIDASLDFIRDQRGH